MLQHEGSVGSAGKVLVHLELLYQHEGSVGIVEKVLVQVELLCQHKGSVGTAKKQYGKDSSSWERSVTRPCSREMLHLLCPYSKIMLQSLYFLFSYQGLLPFSIWLHVRRRNSVCWVLTTTREGRWLEGSTNMACAKQIGFNVSSPSIRTRGVRRGFWPNSVPLG